MLSLDDLQTFIHVAETSSFTEAGQRMGIPKSTVSRRVHRLEEELGVQLMHRTNRAVRLTELGEVLLDKCQRPIQDLAGIEETMADQSAEPAGLLNVSMPGDLGTLYGGLLAAQVRQAHPKIRLNIGVTDRLVDLVAEKVDVAVRIYASGAPDIAGLIGRKIGAAGGALYASPDYLKRHGRPDSPEELGGHEAVIFGSTAGRAFELVHEDGTRKKIKRNGAMVANNFFVVRDAVVQGAGIGWLPRFLADEQKVERVLPDWSTPSGELWIVWPVTRHLSPAVRAFVDVAVPFFSSDCWRADNC
jgi:DNA-binding transcriptional LysR family regulator